MAAHNSSSLANAGQQLRRTSQLVLGLLTVLFLVMPFSSAAQSSSEDAVYQNALHLQNGVPDIPALEHYVSTAVGPHRIDALTWLVVTYRQQRDTDDATKWSRLLLNADEGNPLALEVISNADQQLTRTAPSEPGADEPLSLARQALRGLDRLKKPEGMPDGTFAELKEDIARNLNGAIGYAYFQRHDYLTARNFLRKAVALAPENAQYTYALALADLDGRNAEQNEGFKMLARSVNLTAGTTSGADLANYARQRYKSVGGDDADWNQFLAVTRVPPAPQQTNPESPTVAGNTTPPMSADTVAQAQTSAPLSAASQTAVSEPSQPTHPTPVEQSRNTPAPASTSTALPQSSADISSKSEPPAAATTAPTQPAPAATPSKRTEDRNTMAKVEAPPLPPMHDTTPAPVIRRPEPTPMFPPGAPVSLGILIENAATAPENRSSVINTLVDMVRRLREHDEAFLISFSNEVVFEQDLTNNGKALQEAMDRIKPHPGTALFDAVGFAAGHLKRIAKNPNRVLLVISDGSNSTNGVSPLELSSELTMSGVKIFCIGMQADTPAEQQRLRALADSTGGRAMFLDQPTDFRRVARELAMRLGIPF